MPSLRVASCETVCVRAAPPVFTSFETNKKRGPCNKTRTLLLETGLFHSSVHQMKILLLKATVYYLSEKEANIDQK